MIDVGLWHFSDMAAVLSDVRCWRQSKKHLLPASISPFDPCAASGRPVRVVAND
jgi:hypothetical protein